MGLWVVAVLVMAAAAALAEGSLVFLFNSTARCLDGSAPALSVRLAAGGASRQWVVDFEGGGWCTSWEECLERSRGPRGSSRGWDAAKGAVAGLGSRHFARFNQARLLYCDGASFLGMAGRVERAGAVLHFSGRAVALALLEHLVASHGLARASDVLVSGCSAGGLAALALADTVRQLLPDVPRFKVAVSARRPPLSLSLFSRARSCRECSRRGATTRSAWSGWRCCSGPGAAACTPRPFWTR